MDAILSYVALGCGLLVLLSWIVLLSFFGYQGAKRLRHQDPDPDIRLSYFPSGWQYRFTDPYGTVLIMTGFGSRRKAMRAAVAHRERVGRELEETIGLHFPTYQPEINNKEETHE